MAYTAHKIKLYLKNNFSSDCIDFKFFCPIKFAAREEIARPAPSAKNIKAIQIVTANVSTVAKSGEVLMKKYIKENHPSKLVNFPKETGKPIFTQFQNKDFRIL